MGTGIIDHGDQDAPFTECCGNWGGHDDRCPVGIAEAAAASKAKNPHLVGEHGPEAMWTENGLVPIEPTAGEPT